MFRILFLLVLSQCLVTAVYAGPKRKLNSAAHSAKRAVLQCERCKAGPLNAEQYNEHQCPAPNETSLDTDGESEDDTAGESENEWTENAKGFSSDEAVQNHIITIHLCCPMGEKHICPDWQKENSFVKTIKRQQDVKPIREKLYKTYKKSTRKG